LDGKRQEILTEIEIVCRTKKFVYEHTSFFCKNSKETSLQKWPTSAHDTFNSCRLPSQDFSIKGISIFFKELQISHFLKENTKNKFYIQQLK
jgi:hypothetical protein